MRKKTIHSLALAGLACPLLSCAPKPDQHAPSRESSTASDRHWMHDDRLRIVMAELDRSARTDWPQELGHDAPTPGKAPEAQFSEALQHAVALSEAAKKLPDAIARLRLSEVDRRSFVAQSETLYDQAKRLEDATRASDIAAMQATLDDINATCRSCHTRFCDISGPVVRR